MDKIVITVKRCVQISPDDFEIKLISRVFSTTRSIKDMLQWAKTTGFIIPEISDLNFSEYTGESI